MNDLIEKKWFVFLGEKHEGPFTFDEVRAQLEAGTISRLTYVWAEGMKDWQTMEGVSAFGPLLGVAPEVPHEEPEVNAGIKLQEDPAPEIEVAMPALVAREEATGPVDSQTGDLDPVDMERVRELGAAQAEVTGRPGSGRRTTWHWKLLGLGLLAIGLAVLSLMGILDPLSQKMGWVRTPSDHAHSLLVRVSDRLPLLKDWISPIPHLRDLSPESFSDLSLNARTKIEMGGLKFAIAPALSDPARPYFYVSSNISEDISLHVYLIGISDTLLNQLAFSTEFDLTVGKHLGRTQEIRALDGSAIPKGEYGIYLVMNDIQSDVIRGIMPAIHAIALDAPPEVPRSKKIVAYRSTFLGGENDAIYNARLDDFHAKLRDRAKAELADLKQFYQTIESQFQSSSAKFGLLKKGKVTTVQKRQWEAFHEEWIRFQDQMEKIFEKWTLGVLENEYFYGPLFRIVRVASADVRKVHEVHESYFSGVKDVKAFSLLLNMALSTATKSIANLKNKIALAEQLGTTTRGMPRRDGI